jgi:hypothetical protein
MPVVFVTLISREGYLRQEISPEGRRSTIPIPGPGALGDAARRQDVILPLYDVDRARWIWMMKQATSKIASYFDSQRMMRRYASEASSR